MLENICNLLEEKCKNVLFASVTEEGIITIKPDQHNQYWNGAEEVLEEVWVKDYKLRRYGENEELAENVEWNYAEVDGTKLEVVDIAKCNGDVYWIELKVIK